MAVKFHYVKIRRTVEAIVRVPGETREQAEQAAVLHGWPQVVPPWEVTVDEPQIVWVEREYQ